MLKVISAASLVLLGSAAIAAPIVSNNTISWPDDGWYQVQQVTTSGNVEVCQGGLSCEVPAGEYIVINHSTGERFNGIVVEPASMEEGVIVTANVISWPDNGWYQVLNEQNYFEVCSGVRSCEVTPGSYLVINHSTGERFTGVAVGDDDDTSHSTPIVVTNNTLSWPNDGWYQVQSAATYHSVCEGGTSCDVPEGVYTVINHNTGMRWEGITVGESSSATTRVDFSITVPAYMSSELQVRLNWGEIELSAQWVGDESWSASSDFPSNTEHVLVVTFFDRNGGIPLGTVNQTFKTGVNSAEAVSIAASDFDTERWDDDSDGESNIDELRVGTDPLVPNDDSSLEIVDFHNISTFTQDFESRLTDERPFFENIIREPDFRIHPVPADDIVDIDAEGNGTRTFAWDAGSTYYNRTGTRTRSPNAISWEGVVSLFNSISFIRSEFTNTVTVVDENTREFVEEIVGDLNGDYTQYSATSTRLTGKIIEGTSMCEPVAGMGSTTINRLNPGRTDMVTTFSKAIDDLYWRVVRVRDGVTSEFFARKLIMPASDDPENAFFICDFVDF